MIFPKLFGKDNLRRPRDHHLRASGKFFYNFFLFCSPHLRVEQGMDDWYEEERQRERQRALASKIGSKLPEVKQYKIKGNFK